MAHNRDDGSNASEDHEGVQSNDPEDGEIGWTNVAQNRVRIA